MATYYRWSKNEYKRTLVYSNDATLRFEIVKRTHVRAYYRSTTPIITEDDYFSTEDCTEKEFLLDTTYTDQQPGYYVTGLNSDTCLYSSDTCSIHVENNGDITLSSSLTDPKSVRATWGIGQLIEYVYNLNSSTYPNGGVKDGYYYNQRTTVTSPTAPSGLSYPATITTPSVDVTWTAATSNTNYPVSGYRVDVSTNGGTSWTLAGNPNTNSLSYSITPGVTSIMFRVRAKDSNNQWGAYQTGTASQVLLAPTLTVPQQLMQGQQATVNWTAIEGADSYTLQRKANTDSDWTQVYSGTALTFSETVGTWTTVQYRVQAVFDGTPGGWATSAEIPVVSASALVISGQDGDLGTLVNDVPYSISTDTGNQITATITVNGAVIFSGTVGNSTAGVIPVLDLINGEGTIVIEASVTASSGPVSAVRTWTYTKTMMTFPNAGSIAELTKDGKVMWPETLAEAVRIPGGKTLDQVMGFPCQIYTGSYVGTGTYGQSNPNELTFPFTPKLWGVIGSEKKEYYDVPQNWLLIPWGYTNKPVEWAGTGQIIASYTENTVSYYSNAGASAQNNTTGYVYYYVAIG